AFASVEQLRLDTFSRRKARGIDREVMTAPAPAGPAKRDRADRPDVPPADKLETEHAVSPHTGEPHAAARAVVDPPFVSYLDEASDPRRPALPLRLLLEVEAVGTPEPEPDVVGLLRLDHPSGEARGGVRRRSMPDEDPPVIRLVPRDGGGVQHRAARTLVEPVAARVVRRPPPADAVRRRRDVDDETVRSLGVQGQNIAPRRRSLIGAHDRLRQLVLVAVG